MDNLERRSFSNQTGGTLTKRPSTIKKLTAIPISLNKAFNDRIGENVPHLWNANRNFLELYQPYIKTEWRFYYFAYDTMKAKYKSLKEHINPDLQMFEKDFYEEIQRVDWFLNSNIHEIQRDLQTISDTCDFLNSSNHDDQKKKEELGRTVELFIRSIFEKCKACEKFYKLNHYVICKIAKKFEKLIESGKSKSCDDFTPWRDYPSNDLFNQKFSSRIDEIHYLTRKSVDTYSEKFRKTYPSLAYGELEFVKNKERESVRTRFYIGIKLGLIISTLAWLISDSYVTPNSLLFWTQPGLYVYTTVGNLLLFRFLWAVSIFVWSRYDVNYISVFNLSDTKPNLLLIINQTATQFVLYCVNLMFFFRANCYDSDIANTFLSYGCPSLLVIMCVFYELYEYRNFYNERLSRGVFTKEVVYDLVMAPFAKVTFRDNYAADTMTSFTKVISDFILASCWIVSGAFLKPGQTNSSFGSDYLSCTHHDMHIFIGCMQIYPQYIRIAQCARNYYKTGLTIHLYNIVKYLTTVVVISFGLVYSSYNTQYLVVVVISTLYKWWWDVVMDWGLFDILPTWKGGLAQFYCCSGAEDHSPHATNSNDSINSPGGTSANTSVSGSGKAAVSSRPAGSGMFLRQHLMYPSYTTYYVCIVMDLVLRFLWTVSLLPPTFFGTFVGPKLSFCLASLEIARRAMWGILRLEWEHLKFVKKGTVGFLQQRRKSLKPGMKLLDVINEYDDEPPFNYAAAGNRNKPQPDGHSPRGGKVGPSAAGDDMDLALEMQLYHQSPHSKDFSHINGSIMGSSIHGGSIHQHLSDMVSEFESLETDRSADRIPHSSHLYDNSTAADDKQNLVVEPCIALLNSMGGGASVETLVVTDSKPWIEVHLKKLTEAIEESIYVHEKFPLIIDPSEQAARFLKYQTGTFVNFDDPIQKMTPNLNRGLVGALQYGRTLTLKFSTLEGLDESLFTNKLFPKEILNRSKFFTDEVWQRVLQPSLGDPEPNEMTISSEFVFIICTNTNFVPAELASSMCVIKVIDKNQSAADGANNDSSAVDPEMEQIASLYGASEIIRNSVALVEAAFDGDLDEVQLNLQKGYHLESTDGRKHTALSEAACQGHLEVVTYLLENGADPNAVNDMGRSALWRAAFNSHVEVMQTLLEAGANPDCKDKTSMESVFDVASSEEARAVLSQWDISRTVHLMDARRRIMLANLESRIRTSAEREQLARNLLRKELVEKATAGDVAGIKETLGLIAEEVEKGGGRPRATVEVRNDGGQSLLSIAAQTDNVELATFLLTHYKEVDKDKWDLAEGEVSAEAKIYKANPNSRDLKGWTCLCIAVFHDSRKVLALLLEHGGDPNIRSSYNKNAWDLAKDEIDAAEHVIKSRAEIRQVLVDHDTATRNAAKKQIFSRGATGSGVGLYEGLEKDGTAMVMNIEMNQEMLNNSEAGAEKKSEAKKQGNKGNKAKSSGAGNTNAAVTGKKDGKKK